jgi:hypothetical protein
LGRSESWLKGRSAGTNLPAPFLNPGSTELRAVMNNPDQETLIRAVEDARRILGEYIEPGPRDVRYRRMSGSDGDTVKVTRMTLSRHGPGRNSQCSRPLLTQCDVVSFGSSTGEAAASRLDQDKSSRPKGLSAAL